MFGIIFSNVAVMLIYMFMGFIICKAKKAEVSHAKSMSALLIYVLAPIMLFNSFVKLEYSTENLIRIGTYFLVTLALQIIFFLILYIIFGKKYEDPRYRIMSVGGVLGNVGFIGMPIIASIFPDEPIVLCYSSINVMSMNLIVFTIGVYMITNDKKYISAKAAIFNPTTISILTALPVFLLNINFPEQIDSALDLIAKMVTPVCMIILGMRLSAAKMKDIFTRPFVYYTAALKLLAFPVLAALLVKWIPFMDEVSKSTVIVLACTPAGAVIQSLAELHECEQELAANVVLLTTIISVITIPVVTAILL